MQMNIVHVTDFSNPCLDIYARLTEAQLSRVYGQQKDGLFIAESPNVIRYAIQAGYEAVSLLLWDKNLHKAQPVMQLMSSVPVYVADLQVLEKLTGFALTRGILCAMKRKPLPDPVKVCENAKRVAVFENTVNPTNMGALFRSAAALGMDAVLLSPGCTDPLYRRSVRVSMGGVFQIPWTFLGRDSSGWPDQGIAQLKSLGFTCAALALQEDSISIVARELSEAKKLAVFLGTEGSGLLRSTVALCDCVVKIPMSHGADSLNLAAAGAVAFWQLGIHRAE